MEIYEMVDIQACPCCGGVGMLEQEGGFSCYVVCTDCGAHTIDMHYKDEDEHLKAAKSVAGLWNTGKVISHEPGE